jgi:hypothetical protein
MAGAFHASASVLLLAEIFDATALETVGLPVVMAAVVA